MTSVGWAPTGRGGPVLDHLPHVYGAALAAAADEDRAAEVTERVIADAVRIPEEYAPNARRLAANAILLAMREAPAQPFGSMAPADREAVALARLAGYSVSEIAVLLEIGLDEVKRRLRAGLETLAPCLRRSHDAPRKRPPPPGCGSEASRARDARASSPSPR